MQIEKENILAAAKKAGISQASAESLWSILNEKQHSRIDLASVLTYFGAFIVLLAMGWFFRTNWDELSGGIIFSIALLYVMVFASIGTFFWSKKKLKIPGGVFITLAVCLIPLAAYGFQEWMGLWNDVGIHKDFISWIKGGKFFMEISTIIGGCIALTFFRFPLLTLPIFFAMWMMSMDIAPILFTDSENIWHNQLWVSIIFGIGLLMIAFILDLNFVEDFAFWGYLFGLFAFWTGLSLLESSTELGRFFYLLINIGLMLISFIVQRTIFLIFGGFGVLGYLGSLFYRLFNNSLWFPILISLLGVGIILLGILYNKNRVRVDQFVLGLFPKRVYAWLPKPKKKIKF